MCVLCVNSVWVCKRVEVKGGGGGGKIVAGDITREDWKEKKGREWKYINSK